MNFKQDNPLWKSDLVGVGKSTFHAAGCLVCAVAEAAARCGTEPGIDPRALNTRGVKAGAFVGSSAVIPLLAPCAGLQAPRDRRVIAANGDEELQRAIRQALADGWCALLHVNHGRPDGHGQHFVTAFASSAVDSAIWYADPATGKDGKIDFRSLTGPASWGFSRFRVVGAVPIGPART